MFNNAIILGIYDAAYEIGHYFMEDLVKVNYYTVLDHFVEEFRKTYQYDIKIALLQKTMPLIQKSQIENLMKILDSVIACEDSFKSVFLTSVNPLQTGLLLYQCIDDIKNNFHYSEYTSEVMKDRCQDYMISILAVYKCPNEIKPVLDNLDILGKDCFYYFTKY